MDKFWENRNSSNPNFTFHGNKENELIKEMDFKLKNFDKKRLPKKKMVVKRKKTETLDAEENPPLSKSVSCDSLASRFPVVNSQDDVKSGPFVDSPLTTHYDPVTNYLSPRPKFLMFSPDRHREMLARKETVNSLMKSASYDCVMLFSDEELESSVCFVEETREVTDKPVDNVEETEKIIEKSVDSGEETERVNDQFIDNVEETEKIIEKSGDSGEETEKIIEKSGDSGEKTGVVNDPLTENVEEFDEDEEFRDENGWSFKVFLKWFLVMIVLILTTLTISSVDSPMPSPVKQAIHGYMDLAGFRFGEVLNAISARNYDYQEWDRRDLVVDGDELDEMLHEDEVESKENGSEMAEKLKTDVDNDDILSENDSVQFQESTCCRDFPSNYYEKPNPSKSVKVDENDIFGHLQLVNSDQNDVIEEDLEEKEDDNDHGLIKNEFESVKTDNFGPFSKALIGISLLIFAISSVSYYAMQTGISSLERTPKNEASNDSGSVSSFDQSTADSQSHGSFTIEKLIVKKQNSKTPESTISKVRRSSRIHNRFVTPSP